MLFKQKILSIIISIIVFSIILDFVRKKRLKEELAWVWISAGLLIAIFAIWEKSLILVTRFTGIIDPTSIVFFFGIIFLILINLQLSVKISKDEEKIKNLAQEMALFEHRLGGLECGRKDS